jgi:hypothetical protein
MRRMAAKRPGRGGRGYGWSWFRVKAQGNKLELQKFHALAPIDITSFLSTTYTQAGSPTEASVSHPLEHFVQLFFGIVKQELQSLFTV